MMSARKPLGAMWEESVIISVMLFEKVLDVPHLSREKWGHLVHRKDKKPNRRLKVRRKVWELPPPRVTTPCTQIFIGEEVWSPTTFVPSPGTVTAVQEGAYKRFR